MIRFSMTIFGYLGVWCLILTLGRLAPGYAGTGPLRDAALVVCLPSPVASLDPTDYRDRETQIVLKQMFDSLTRRDSDLSVMPHLAESFRSVSDVEWEFKLKKGIQFHNGDPLTAKDVRFTFERVIQDNAVNGHTSARQSLFGPLSDVVVLDDDTLRFKTRTPWPILPLMLTLQEIVPQDYMTRVGEQGFQARPVGTGPFRFVEQRGDGTLVLKRFHREAMDRDTSGPKGGVSVEYLEIRSESDVVKRIAMIKRGQADLITRIPPEFLDVLSMNPDFRTFSQPATRSYFVEMNCRKKPFNDPNVRKAMNYAVDMTMVVRTVLQGKGQALPTVLLPKAFAFDPLLYPYAYSPDKAKALLNEARFPQGYTVAIYCESVYEAFAQAVSMYLSRIGIRSTVVTGDRPTAVAAMETLSADMMVSSWGNTTLDPVGIVPPKFQSQGRGNYSGYQNKEVDDLLAQAEKTMEPDKRKACYQAVQRIVYKDAPMIFGYAVEEFHVVRRNIVGVEAGLTGMLDLSHAVIKKDKAP